MRPTPRLSLICAVFALFAAIGLLRHWAWHACTLDMAYYARLVWGLGRGDPSLPVVDAPHWLGLHFEPILLPVAALVRAGLPATPTLLLVQAAAAAAALVPAWRLVGRHVPAADPRWALALYLLPAYGRCLDFDFHPNTVAVWPLLAFVEAVDGGRPRAAAGWLLLGLACREDVGLQAAAALAVATGVSGRWRWGLGAFGLAWCGLYLGVVQPAFAHGHPQSSLQQHFGALGLPPGGGALDLLRLLAASPGRVVGHLATVDRLVYPLGLLAVTGLLPLRAPRWLAGAAPIVALNLLSGFEGVRALDSHYLTAATPFLFAAAAIGAGRPRRLDARLPPLRRLALCAGLGLLVVPETPPWARARSWFPDADTERFSQAAARIPTDAAVVAPSEILAHLAERPRLYHRRFAPSPEAARDLWRISPAGEVTPPEGTGP